MQIQKYSGQTEFFQDSKSIIVKLPIKGVSLKKIDVEIFDFVLKINIKEKNFLKIFDLAGQVQPQSKENQVIYQNEVLQIVLIKQNFGEDWPGLIEKTLSKEELKSRRQESFRKKEEYSKKFQDNVKELKIKYDRFSTEEQMRIEDNERKLLDQMKKIEKAEAEEKIFEDLDSEGRFKSQQPQIKHQIKQEESQGRRDEDEQDKQVGQDNIVGSFQKTKHENQQNDEDCHNQGNEIFEDDYFKDEIGNNKCEQEQNEDDEQEIQLQQKVIPEIRNQKQVQLKFTDKVYANLANREHFFKEAPMPKIKDPLKKDKNSDEINPIFLKDKADQFYKDGDYYSALNAYNQAYRQNNKLIVCVQNKAACNLKLFNYKECLEDCQFIIDQIKAMNEDEQNNPTNQNMLIKSKFRQIISYSWGGNFDKAFKILDELKQMNSSILTISLNDQINTIENQLNIRLQSQKIKTQGDQFYQLADYSNALEKYLLALEIDQQNEKIISNIGLIYLKLEKHEQSLEYSQKSIDIIKSFISHSNFHQNFKQSSIDAGKYLCKILLRKAKSLKQLKQRESSFQAIREILLIDELNKEARKMQQELDQDLKKEEGIILKEKGIDLFQKGEYFEALTIFNESIKKFQQVDYIDILSILLNKCACHFKRDEWDDIISCSQRGLKNIRNLRTRVFAFDDVMITKEDREKLNNFEVRFLIRRGNAYLKQNQIYMAKADFEEALKIDPKNDTIQKDLQQLKAVISQ